MIGTEKKMRAQVIQPKNTGGGDPNQDKSMLERTHGTACVF
jgi:hypothetical protein